MAGVLSDGATERRARRMGYRRRGILDAAARVFADVGYERATLEGIGEAVGLSKTSLYYYVRSKEDLLARLLTEVTDEIGRQAAAGLPVDAPAGERLWAFVRAHVRVVCTTPAGRVLARNQDVVLGEASSRMMREARRRHERLLRSILAQGIGDGVFRPIDVRVGSSLILGALNVAGRWDSPEGAVAADRIAEELFTMVVGGIAAHPGEAAATGTGAADAQ